MLMVIVCRGLFELCINESKLVEVADFSPCFCSFPSSSYQTFKHSFLYSFWCNNILLVFPLMSCLVSKDEYWHIGEMVYCGYLFLFLYLVSSLSFFPCVFLSFGVIGWTLAYWWEFTFYSLSVLISFTSQYVTNSSLFRTCSYLLLLLHLYAEIHSRMDLVWTHLVQIVQGQL